MKRIAVVLAVLAIGILLSSSAFSAKKKSSDTTKKTAVKQEESRTVKKTSTAKDSDSEPTKAPTRKSDGVTKSETKSGVTSSSLTTQSPLSVGDPEVGTSNVLPGEEILWEAVTSGGGLSASTNFSVLSAIGQPAIGMAASTNFGLNSGFIQNFEPTSSGCCDVPGDSNNSGTVNIADATYLIAYIFSGGGAPGCCDEGNANGSATINISDATYIIAYIFSGGAAPVCLTPDLSC